MTIKNVSGLASISIDGKKSIPSRNLSHKTTSDLIFHQYSGFFSPFSKFNTLSLRATFRRHSPLRPYVENYRHKGYELNGSSSAYYSAWTELMGFTGTVPANVTNGSVVINRGKLTREFRCKLGLLFLSGAIGGQVISHEGNDEVDAPFKRSIDGTLKTDFSKTSFTEVDIPNNSIGNIHKHPVARQAWFNEVGIVPLSQGEIVISGEYSPPEPELHHSGFQVYVAKSGGTGVVVGAEKNNGETFPAATSAFTFRDATFNAFVVGDVGKYIAIHGRGIYLITAFVSSSVVETDAVTINEDFVNATGLTWTLRTGPIAEYFVRRRPYVYGDTYANSTSFSDGTGFFQSEIGEDLLGYGDARTDYNQIPQRIVHDGYGHWWWTTPNRKDLAYGVLRQLCMSNQSAQSIIVDGKFEDMTDFGGLITGTNWYWQDICSDLEKKLWFSCRPADNSKYGLMRVDPAPGLNAESVLVLDKWRKQTGPSDADGLASAHTLAISDDRSGVYSGGVDTHRIWVLGGADEPSGLAGGLSYSDDDGATWGRVHQLPPVLTGTVTATSGSAAVTGSGTTFLTHYAVGDRIRFAGDDRSYKILLVNSNTSITLTETYAGSTGGGKTHAKIQPGLASLTSGSGTVTGVDADFLTELAVGDWVRFGSDTRSYEVTVITDDDDMTISPVYAGSTRSNVAIRRGGLESNEAIGLSGRIVGVQGYADSDGQYSLDWDTDGNVYWISSSNRICKWNPGTGACVSFADTQIPAMGGLSAMTSGGIRNLRVSRIPTKSGGAEHPFHNDLWLGCKYLGGSSVNSGWVRVIGSSFSAAPTSANFTRYHYNATDDNFPTSMRVPGDGSGTNNGVTSVFVDNVTGNIALVTTYSRNSDSRMGWHWMNMVGANYYDAQQSHLHSFAIPSSAREHMCRCGSDDQGMGLIAAIGGQDASYTAPSTNQQDMSLHFIQWVEYSWNGSEWERAPVCFNINDPMFRTVGNANTDNAILGSGLRRASEWSVAIDYGVEVAFEQAGGGTAQSDEFIVDESSTFVCAIGVVKDNTQTADIMYSAFLGPTVFRNCDEPIREVVNMRTDDNGVDGAFNTVAGSVITTGRQGLFGKGFNDYFANDAAGSGAGYPGISSLNVGTAVGPNHSAYLRIEDELENDNDGSWSGGGNLFTTAGGHVFTGDDVGKSIFIEGANGSSTDPDNGQAVIVAVNSGSEVEVDKTFTTTRTAAVGRRWKLRDVPVVTYVKYSLLNAANHIVSAFTRNHLLSSSDFGENWDIVKYMLAGVDVPADGPDEMSSLIRISPDEGRRTEFTGSASNTQSSGCAIVFDLSDLPENSRRRQLWRAQTRRDSSSFSMKIGGVFLYDQNYNLLNRPDNNKIVDSDEDEFWAVHVNKVDIINATGINASAVDIGEDFTDTVSVPTGLYLDSGVNDAQVTSAGRFIDSGASFTRIDIGKRIRISSAANAGNLGWAIVTGFISSTEVQTSKSFVNETNTFSWQITKVGPGDEMRIDSDDKSLITNISLSDLFIEVDDVPSSSSIKLTRKIIPVGMANEDWSVGHEIQCFDELHPSQIADFDAMEYIAVCSQEGTVALSENLEFVVVQSSSVSATTPADDDGDARTDIVVMGEALTSVDGPVVGDVIELSHSGYGKRYFTIKAITGSDPAKSIKLSIDDMTPGLASGLTWRILRRRGLQYQIRQMIVVSRTEALA